MSARRPTVREVTDECSGFLVSPPAPGPRVCPVCSTFRGEDFAVCIGCGRAPRNLAAVSPIIVSQGLSASHDMLRQYKRDGLLLQQRRVAAILWRFLDKHERCLANAAAASSFDLVTTVPSGDKDRDEQHQLRRIVSSIGATKARYDRVLRRSDVPATDHQYVASKFAAVRPLDGQRVLLVDDMWTSGASAQAAAQSLLDAGASCVACVVVGRFVDAGFADNAALLRELPSGFGWDRCVHCA